MIPEGVTPPHCDQSVLHAPGECRYCDRHPDWQAYRAMSGIAFTGHEPRPLYPGGRTEAPCPSDYRRGVGQAHVWGGNRPTEVDVPQEETAASRAVYGAAGADLMTAQAVRARDVLLAAAYDWQALPSWVRALYDAAQLRFVYGCVEADTRAGRLRASGDDWLVPTTQGGCAVVPKPAEPNRRANVARDAAFAELVEWFSDEGRCGDYMAAGPPDIARAILDYAEAHPTGADRREDES